VEYKSIPTMTKSVEGRTVTGLFAIHGNVDSYLDISHPGAFSKTIAESLPRVKFLWNHDMWGGPPVAKVKSIREVGRDELPEKVLALAPDATGGVEVVREYLKTPRGDELLTAIQEEAVDEMSYGYDPVKWDMGEVNGMQVRNLREIRLWEVSDVIFGANPATAASKFLQPIDLLLAQIEGHLKAGARHSAADVKLLNAIHKAAVTLGATSCKGSVEEDEEEGETDKDEKSRAGLVPLTLLKSKLDLLELEIFSQR
jgi:HK97 family phage prohead protease